MGVDGTFGPSHTLGKAELGCAVFASESCVVVAGKQGGFVLDVKGWRGQGEGGIETLFELHAADGIGCLASLPDGTVVATGKGGAVEIWDCATGGRRTLQPAGKNAGYHGAAVRGDGLCLALAGGKSPGGVEVWDLGKGALSATFGEDHDAATALAFVEKTLVVGTVRGRLLLFDT
jgi:WD40 repeat protein